MLAWLSRVALLSSLLFAGAANATFTFQEYEKRIKSAQEVSALKSDLFGDQISLYNGSTEFRATDISIPGNSSLEVALRRRLRVQSDAEFSQPFGGFGSWDLDVPYIQGTYLDNWGSFSHPGGRCSSFQMPKAWGDIQTRDYWSGVKLNIPGQGEQDILTIANLSGPYPKMKVPTDGYVYKLGTKDFHRIRCKTNTANGFPGEGFIVLTPDGTTMTFDVGITRNGGTIGKPIEAGQYADASRTRVYLLVSTIVDRFGNSVTYNWQGDKLQSISSSDGRLITLSWSGNVIASATTNSRPWSYEYMSGHLSRVVLPDGSSWSYNTLYAPSRIVYPFNMALDASDPGCSEPPEGTASGWISITHPSGAEGLFTFEGMRHRRTGIPASYCYLVRQDPNGEWAYYELGIPDYFDVISIKSKRISGVGIQTGLWTYAYEVPPSGRVVMSMSTPLPCSFCDKEKKVRVTEPDGSSTDHVFGTLYEGNDGQLLGTYRRDAQGVIRRSERHEYVTPAEAQSMLFPELYGYNLSSDDGSGSRVRPIKQTVIAQDGYINEPGASGPPPGGSVAATTFTKQVTAFSHWGQPATELKFNSIGHSKTDTTTYEDNLTKWVIGQVATQSINGVEVSRTDFYPTTSLPQTTWRFSKPQQSFTYRLDGTVETVTDGNSHIVWLSNWKRGIPQVVQFPATAEHPSGTTKSVVVDNNGWITSVVNELGSKHCYLYDDLGRMTKHTYPSETQPSVCDESAWNATNVLLAKLTSSHWLPQGIQAGYWRQFIHTGNSVKVLYLDALWRPVLELAYDGNDVWGSMVSTRTGYDTSGRVSFKSYPVSGDTPTSSGTRTFYDALDRVVRVDQNSEHGVLSTHTEYLAGLQTRVTNPKLQSTSTGFMAWDQPTLDFPIWSVAPEDKVIEITRHQQLGHPLSIKQRNGNGTLQQTRYYVYDQYNQLCKTIEPETGATVMDYDGAGNLQWSAAGLALPNTQACDTIAARDSGRKVTRIYDARNRLKMLSFPDNNGNQSWTYEADGLPASVVTSNDQGASPVIQAYHYNKRRLPDGQGESLQQPNWYTWGIGYAYDRNGFLAGQTYPTGLYVDYAPNGLGQATKAGSFATGAAYHPNGALKHFTYGNGIVHAMVQNARQLPVSVVNTGGVLDNLYEYDNNGNVTAIHDYAQGANFSRSLSYDNLDRLTAANSCSFGGDCWHRFTYDALDNLTSWKHGGVKDYATYDYHPTTNQLTNIRNTAGSSIVGLGYDLQGNIQNKNGDNYLFDYGNRLRMASKTAGPSEGYRYDGYGRRVLSWNAQTGAIDLFQYSLNGQLLQDWSSRKNSRSEHIYLAGSIVAINEVSFATWATTVKYQHTDPLGSPVAVTNQAGQVIERTVWEPYGAAVNKPSYSGVGYTGHVMDGVTGLNYMQQRYYDPGIGRFLSVDPVTAYEKPLTNFNRYVYALNNPYRFSDPDGRNAVTAFGGVLQESWNALNGRGFDGQMVLGALRDGYDGEGAGVAASAFEDATAVVPGGVFTKIGQLGGVLKNAATGLGASRSEISAAGKAIVGMLRESKGFAESTLPRSIANLDVKLGVGAAKDALANAGFKAGTVSGGRQSFTNGSVRFTFSTSSKGVSTIYVAVKGEQLLKIRLK